MKRWLVVSLGIALAAVALYVLLSGRARTPSVDEIDDASRAQLERVLREAEREGAAQ